MSITSALNVANYILWLLHEAGDLPTNMKMQKLVYYAHAWYLAIFDEPLLDGHFEAWIHGAVHPDLYHRLKVYGWDRIGEHPSNEPSLPESAKQHIKDILDVYNGFTAWDLERMCHSEKPWIEARAGIPNDKPSRNIIKDAMMKEYYKSLAESD